jgi:hypothetical protein
LIRTVRSSLQSSLGKTAYSSSSSSPGCTWWRWISIGTLTTRDRCYYF